MTALAPSPITNPQLAVSNLLLECSFIGRSDTELTMQLPLNRTPLGILLEANRLSIEINGKPLVSEDQIDQLRNDPHFTTPIRHNPRVYLQMNVENVSKQDKITEIEILAIAQALYQLDHGKDILQGNLMRLQDFALVNCSNGIHVIPANEIETCRFKYNKVRWAIETKPWQD